MHLSRAEWRWVFTGSLLAVALTCVPYLYAYLAAPTDSTFGGFFVSIQDGNSYLAKMYHGYNGEWLFRLPYAPEDQKGLLVYTFYIALGHVARVTALPFNILFHLTRILFGAGLLITVYLLAALLTDNISARRWSFGIAAFAGGLALISILAGRNDPYNYLPMDLFVPEMIGFYSVLANPHFPLGFALQAWAFVLIVQPPVSDSKLTLLGVAALAVGVALIVPYLIPVAYISLGVAVLLVRPFNRAMLLRLFLFGAITGAFVLYDFAIAFSDPFIIAWSKQSFTLTPALIDVLLGVGIWLPLALLGFWRAPRSPLAWALLVWLIAALTLIFFPYSLQRKFISGFFIPLAIFSGIGVSWLLQQLLHRRWLRTALVFGLILFGFSANLLIFFSLLRAPAIPALYIKNDEVRSLQWLATQVKPTEVVLADARLGNLIPAWTGARVIYGHPMESFDAIRREAEVTAFFNENDLRVLDHYPIAYIFGGEAPPGWRIVWQSGAVKIYAR